MIIFIWRRRACNKKCKWSFGKTVTFMEQRQGRTNSRFSFIKRCRMTSYSMKLFLSGRRWTTNSLSTWKANHDDEFIFLMEFHFDSSLVARITLSWILLAKSPSCWFQLYSTPTNSQYLFLLKQESSVDFPELAQCFNKRAGKRGEMLRAFSELSKWNISTRYRRFTQISL